MKLNYRPEIDGLRAIAVGAVILYHAQISIFNHQFFKGGFVGVDIFFVISGYLITSIIIKEMINTGSFSFKYFYERRIRRIIPVLIFVILISCLFAWLYLFPSDMIDFAKSILYSLGFSSNIYFHHSGQLYGAESGLFKPFLHTWSLSVEEQYYILFPLILLVVLRYLKKYLLQILFVGFIISLGTAEWTSRNHPSISFYFLHTRIWELLSGSILACMELKRVNKKKDQLFNDLMPFLGVVLIFFSIFYFNDKMHHPSLFTVLPILGVSLIIWFSNKNEPITKILSTKLFVGIGLISYSLYLWHYPIFAFARITQFTQESLFKKLFLALMLIIFSIISYYFIERPARNKKNKFKNIFTIILLIIFLLVIFNLNIINKDGFKDRFYYSQNYKLDKLDYKNQNKNFELNYDYDDYDDRKNVLIVGNSHGEDILKILSKTKYSNKIYFNLTSPKIRTKELNYQISSFYEFLIDKNLNDKLNENNFFRHLKKQYNKSDLILLASKYTYQDIDILDKLIKILKNDNKKIIIFDNALEQKINARLNRLDYYVFKNQKLPNQKILKSIEEKMFGDLINKKDVNQKIKEIAQNNKIYLIERKKIFCNIYSKTCPSLTEDGYKIYWDYGHITDKGAEFFARKIEKDQLFLKYLRKIFPKIF